MSELHVKAPHVFLGRCFGLLLCESCQGGLLSSAAGRLDALSATAIQHKDTTECGLLLTSVLLFPEGCVQPATGINAPGQTGM